MIVAQRKPLEEILESIKSYNRILLAGCGGCVTVCFSGGEKAVELLASQIAIARKKAGRPIQIIQCTPHRQCEYEFIEELAGRVDQAEAVLSTACGVGIQAMTVKYPNVLTIPALNTSFMGYPVEHAVWEERCAGCGDCVLEWTGGICPIARCAKKLLNGPCGGSMKGKCEVDRDTDCAWQLIYDRLLALGRADSLKAARAAKDWRTSTASGQRKARFEEGMI